MPWTLPGARQVPPGLGLRDGRLADCPSRPNCVSSQTAVIRQRVEPWTYTGSRDAARGRLARLLAEDARATIVTAREDYLHVEFKAFVFVDDVEFYFPPDESLVHLRSCSRVGHSDLGANRRRLRALKKVFSSAG